MYFKLFVTCLALGQLHDIALIFKLFKQNKDITYVDSLCQANSADAPVPFKTPIAKIPMAPPTQLAAN
jgi:hypothetical protein